MNRKYLSFAFVSALSVAALFFTQTAKVSAAGIATDTKFNPPPFAKPVPPERALLLPDGKYLAFFDPDTLTDQPAGAITRYLADGTIDSSFKFSRVYKQVSAAAAAGNGKICVAASRYANGAKEAEEVLRLNVDGSIDTSFTPAAVGQTSLPQEITQLLVQPDGKVLVVGLFQNFGGNAGRNNVVRLLSDGSLDPGFGPYSPNNDVYSIALQPDGKILIGGIFSGSGSFTSGGVARLNANGTLDSSFNATGFVRNTSTTRVRGIAVQPDGLIVISGNFKVGTSSSAPRMPILRLNPSGTVDSTFNSSGIVTSINTGRDLVIQPDGKIVAVINNSVYRLNSNGSNDTSFHQPVIVNATFQPPFAGTPVSVQLQPDGRILLGGIFTDVDASSSPSFAHFGVARLNADGTLDSGLITTHTSGVEVAPTGFARLNDGSTLVTFGDTVYPPLPYNVGRLLSDGSVDPSFTLSSSDPSRFLSGDFTARGLERLSDGNFLVHGVTTNGAPVYGKVQPNGAEDTSFATNSGRAFEHAIVAPNGAIVVDAGTNPQMTISNPLGRLSADGQIESFGAPDSIYSVQVIRYQGQLSRMNVGSRVLAVQPDAKVLYAYFDTGFDNNGTTLGRYHLVRLNSDSSVDNTFTETIVTPTNLSETFPLILDPSQGFLTQPPDGAWSAASSFMDARVLDDGRIVVAGHFTSFANTNAHGIVRLGSNGAIDNTFNAGAGPQWTTLTETATFYPYVLRIEPQPDGKYLVIGNFEAFNGVPAPGIARLNENGSVDTAFVAPVHRDKFSRASSELKAQPDGSLLLSGPYAVNGESSARSLVRLTSGQPGAVNISTRLGAGTGDDALIEGFIVTGPAGSSKKLIVRAIGPSLSQFGIADALANPTLEIHDASNAIVATNNDWKTTQTGGLITGSQVAEIAASGAAPTNDLESAIIVDLQPGSYTALVRGTGNTSGTAVVDAFDLSSAGANARLANIATRGLIEPGDKLMVAGFIVANGPVQAVVRAIGPSLGGFGISNALPDTTLQLRDQQGNIVMENDDWKTSQKQELENAGLQPTHDLEAALLTTIQPGQYTAQVRGKGNDSGVGVVQVYFLQ